MNAPRAAGARLLAFVVPWAAVVASALAAALLPTPAHAAPDRVAVPPPGTDPARWTSVGYPKSWSPSDPVATTHDPRVARPALGPVAGSVTVATSGAPWTAAPSSGPRGPVAVEVGPCDPCGPAFPRFAAFGSYGRPSVSGTMLITRGGEPGSGSEIDVDDTLGLDDGDVFEVGIAWAPFARHRVFVAYERFAFDAEEVLPESVIFRDVMFDAGDRVASSLELDIVKAGYEALLAGTPSSSLRAGIAGWIWRYQGSLENLDGPEDQSRSFTHVLPVAHVAADAAFGVLHVAARAAGGWIGTDRYVIDLSGGIGVRLWDRLSLDLGWRWTRFVFDETTNEGDLVFSGPYVGLTVDF